MRAGGHEALLIGAVSALLACSPETAGPGPVVPTTHKAGAGAGGMGGASAAPSSSGMPEPMVVLAQSGSLAVAAALPPQPPSSSGPSAALARIEPLAHKEPVGGIGGSKPGASGAAGLGGPRPMPASNVEMPAPELCQRLREAAAMRPLPRTNQRLTALLVACTVAEQVTAGAAAQGGSNANAGDVPDARELVSLAGTAVFTDVQDGVSLLIVLDGCKDGALYPVRIHAGHGCADANSIGESWDQTRGEDIPDLRCNGAHASHEYVRPSSAAKAWSLAGPSVSDVIGHALVIDDPDDRSLPIACGVVTAP